MRKRGFISEAELKYRCCCCINYKPLIKEEFGILTKMARGTCLLNSSYKQRTESCQKYKTLEDKNE